MLDLPRGRILRGYRAFSRVLAMGKSVTSGPVRLFYAPSGRSPVSRAGFSVSRSIRTAAVRNRIKRCMREAYRRYPKRTPIPGTAVDLVFLYRGDHPARASSIDCQAVEKEVHNVLNRLYGKKQT